MKVDARRLEWAIRKARVTVALVGIPLVAVMGVVLNVMIHPRTLVLALTVMGMLAAVALGIWLMGSFTRFICK